MTMSNNRNQLISITKLAKEIGLFNKKTGKPSTHTLRFWETKFKQIKPTILSGNRRYYTNKDVEIIKMVNYLLKDQRLTIEGAIKVMNNNRIELDDSSSSSIKAQYYKNKIKLKSKNILRKLKKLNG